MYKKLIAGEFGLRDTFWKYGVMGTLISGRTPPDGQHH